MKNNYVLSLFFSFFFSVLVAQNGQDSVVYTLADTVVANQYHKDGNDLMGKGKYDEAIDIYFKALAIRLKLLGNVHIKVAALYNNLGNAYWNQVNYERAIEYHAKSLAIRLNKLGEEHNDVSASYRNLGGIYYDKGNYNKAIEYFEKALFIQIKTLGAEHHDVAGSYVQLANSYMFNSDYNKAIECHEKALYIVIKTLGAEHPNVATIYSNLAVVYTDKGNYEKAIEYHEKALTIRLKKLSNEHSDLVLSYFGLANIYQYQGNYEKAIQYYEKALVIQIKTLGTEHLNIAALSTNMGKAYDKIGDYKKSIEYQEKALAIHIKTLGTEHPNVALNYTTMGSTYREKGNYDKAIKYEDKALAIRLKKLGYEHPDVANSYVSLGLNYMEKGDYDKAIQYNEKALTIWLKKLGNEHPNLAKVYNNLGNANLHKKDYDKAIQYYEKAVFILIKNFSIDNADIATPWSNLGIALSDKGDYDKAIEYYEKSLSILIQKFGTEHPNIAITYSNLGYTYGSKNNYDKEIEYFEKALTIWLKTLGNEHPNVAMTFNNLGGMYQYSGNYDKAIGNYQKALSANRYYSQQVLDSVMSMKELLVTLNQYSITHTKQYTQTQDTTYLSQTYDLSNQALNAVAYQFKTLNTEGSKADLLKSSIDVSENALHINQLMSSIKDDKKLLIESFTNAERAKSLILFGSLRETDALSYAGIPDSLLQKESDLRIDIAFYEKRRFEEESKGKEAKDSIVNSYNSQLFDLKRSYETLKERFEKDFPEYYRLKYDLSTASLKYVQDTLLRKDQTLLEYFVGDSSIFIFTVNKDNYKVLEVKKDFALDSLVEAMRTGIYNTEYLKQPDSLMRFTTRYVDAAATLYDKLVAPVKTLLRGSVVVVPDGVLGYLPFDALLINKPNSLARPDKFNYLLNDYKISYCYSATILKDMVNKKHRKEPTQPFLAMAPYFKGDTTTIKSDSTDYLRNGLDSLPYTGEEVTRLQRIMGGEAIVGKAATEDIFTKKASDARIIHLSTHGKMDDKVGDYSYLAFTEQADSIENEWLYTRELYNLSLNADMVVLSACETGIGKLQRGEGIISLARAFAYAGAKSIVTTLWQVKDESTKDIMVDFYKNLKRGKDKDEALQLAKLAYIKKHKNTFSLPFFWSGIIPIGDMKAIGK